MSAYSWPFRAGKDDAEARPVHAVDDADTLGVAVRDKDTDGEGVRWHIKPPLRKVASLMLAALLRHCVDERGRELLVQPEKIFYSVALSVKWLPAVRNVSSSLRQLGSEFK